MNRRQALRLPLTAAAAFFLGGHTPYGQWVVYRKKHLLIGCHKEDSITYDLAKRVVDELALHLPAAKPRIARAPSAARLASLLGTGQMDVAILDPTDALAMRTGSDGFEPYGAIPLRLLMPVGDRILVARADFPERHAWLVSGALSKSDLTPAQEPRQTPNIPWHPGSLAFLEGRPEPSR